MNKDNIQELWSKLPDKELDCKDWIKRVLMFDPINVPKLFSVKQYQRRQIVSVLDLFPVNGNLCGCGCGQEVKKPKRRWATEECELFAVNVRFIIAGHTATISKFMRRYYGWNCAKCGCEDKGHDMGANGSVSWIKVDHIIPVKLGGGSCWLSNYQLLCHDCHVGKTNNDFNWKQSNQIKIFSTEYLNQTNHEQRTG